MKYTLEKIIPDSLDLLKYQIASDNNCPFSLEDAGCIVKTEELTVAQIIEKFGYTLTEKDIENLIKLRDGNNLDI